MKIDVKVVNFYEFYFIVDQSINCYHSFINISHVAITSHLLFLMNHEIQKRIEELDQFIENNSDSRERKRAIVVQLILQGLSYKRIAETMNVSAGFISKCNKRYKEASLEGLKVSYKGSSGYLTQKQKQDVINWLKKESNRSLDKVERYLIDKYGISFKSKSSYYNLLKESPTR